MTKYETHVLPHIQSVEGWVLGGLTEEEIAQRLGIGCRTLKKYKREHKEFGEILNSGKDRIIARVEEALIKKAIGYTYTEKKTVDKGDRTEETITEKVLPPDLSAISFVLKNYCPEKWGDLKNEISAHHHAGGVVILPEILNDEEESP